MILMDKHPKFSRHIALMPINNRRLIKLVMLICFNSAMFLCYGVDVVHFSNDHNTVSSLICVCKNKPPMEFLNTFLQISKI